jgi:2,4-dienoyl-CoA reductase-like NADH-dependent reductase (Old Yellow Enzyme family)
MTLGGRHDYKIFAPARIGDLRLKNRLVRSATWDPCIFAQRKMTDEVVDLYGKVAAGGVGTIITGGFPVVQDDEVGEGGLSSYEYVQIEGVGRLVDVVRSAAPDCTIVAQLETGHVRAGPSAIDSPFGGEGSGPLTTAQIHEIVDCFVAGVVSMKEHGFDGVQLHGAHGGLLSRFLSPYTNRRDDEYGGSAANRSRIVREIVQGARERVGDFPIMIKLNCTDYVEGGLDIDTFPELAAEIESAGVDAIEVSGGMWDCLVRTEEELGFRPVPAPESHTAISSADRQSYFLEYAERLELGIPVILVGGNRDVERLEQIVRQGTVDLIALCRPLISEPDLPNRWLEGRGSSGTDCISCNSCIHDMFVHPGKPGPGLVRCVFKHDKAQHRMAQKWLASWVERNVGA